MTHSSCQEPAPVWDLHGFTVSFTAHPPTAVWDPPQSAVCISAPRWSSVGCRGRKCFTTIFCTGCREISAPGPGALHPHCSSLTLAFARVLLLSSFFPLFFTVCAVFFPFSNMLFPRCYHLGWGTHLYLLCPARGSPWPLYHPSMHIYTCIHIFLL